MAFNTNVLRDGQWVTETVDYGAALRASSDSKAAAGIDHERGPLGVLSRTIVSSPVVNFILPVSLRSRDYNDIAYISDRSICIKEQKGDGQQNEVLSYHDFEARIRNAVVLGPPPEPAREHDSDGNPLNDGVKRESLSAVEGILDDDMDVDQSQYHLPPQILVLMLENGKLCFVFIEKKSPRYELELFMTTFDHPRKEPYMGYHLAIDPSFRYIAAATPEEILTVYELKSLEALTEEYRQFGTIQPVISTQSRVIHAVIHSVDFLYPRPQDDYHVIMVIVVCRMDQAKNRAWRILVHDWEVGESIRTVLSQQKMPLRLPELPDIPLFVVPLRFQSTFFMVFRSHVCLVKQALSVPEYEFTPLPHMEKSDFHYGAGAPLWSAWARPFRRKSYMEKFDIIYLAREDGIVLHIELESSSLLHSATQIGSLDTNIGKAFTAGYDVFSDLLIIGGEPGPGGIWKLPARSELQKISTIPNWTPVIDAVSTDDPESLGSVDTTRPNTVDSRLSNRPSRIFFATRRGPRGSIIEPRVGMQARIGLEMDFGEPTSQAWMFPDIRSQDVSFYAIISLPYSTTVLCFSQDFKEVRSEPAETTPFDLSARTVFATHAPDDMIIQITETSVTLVTPSQSSRHYYDDILPEPGTLAQKAFFMGDIIVLSVQSGQRSYICILRVDQMNVGLVCSWEMEDDINCLTVVQPAETPFVISGSFASENPYISIYSLDAKLVAREIIRKTSDTNASSLATLEAFTSLQPVQKGRDSVDIAVGTRCGHLVTIHIEELSSQPQMKWMTEKIGLAPVEVFKDNNTTSAVFTCCDNKLLYLSHYSGSRHKFKQLSIVWPTDLSDPSLNAPLIHSAFSLQAQVSDASKGAMLLLLAGTNILLTEFRTEVEPVPRTMAIPGSPTKLLYSHVWSCLIVSVQIDTKPTLIFVEPDTGDLISVPVDKNKNPCDFIGGLGQAGDRICGLYEWVYVKDGQTFPFIIVTTQDGCLLIVSIREREVEPADGGSGRRLEYWTRYRKKGFKEPVYSVVPDEEGLVYCVGRILHWDILDLAEKKMRPVSSFELDSTATSLSFQGEKVLALSSQHSLEVIDRNKTSEHHHMELMHTDEVTRVTSHMIPIGSDREDKHWPVHLVSDLAGGIAGLWVPLNQPKRDLVSVFEGTLKNTVRKFVRASCRQAWLEDGGLFGSLRSTNDDAEILGVSLNGTIQQFKFLGPELWRLLYLISSMVRCRSPEEDGLSYQLLTKHWSGVFPQEVRAGVMHIDGDLMMECLNDRSLDKLVNSDYVWDVFFFCLDELGNGTHTAHIRHGGLGKEDMEAEYCKVAYNVLEYLLRPVL